MSVDEMEDAIIGLSNETGIAAGDIADNVYTMRAVSALFVLTVCLERAVSVLPIAVSFSLNSCSTTKLATAGFAESGDTLDILTTILNAYGLEAEKASFSRTALFSAPPCRKRRRTR